MPSGIDLGVQDVGAGAEVDDVKHGDVLAELLVGDLQLVQQMRGVELPPGAAGVDQDAGERHQAGKALGPDRGVGLMTVGLELAELAARPRRSVLGAAAPVRPRSPDSPVCRSISSPTRSWISSTSSGGPNPRVLAEAEDPGNQLTGVGVGGDKQPIPSSSPRAHLAVAAEMALDLPGDS